MATLVPSGGWTQVTILGGTGTDGVGKRAEQMKGLVVRSKHLTARYTTFDTPT